MKTYQSWLLGALACATIVPFTGCTKDEMVGPNGGDGETVKTEFTVKFTRGNQTKASADEVGSSSSFAGMDNIYLVGYGTTAAENYVTGTDDLIDRISLSKMDAGTENNFTKKYNISLLPQKQSFMFYGESSINSANTGVGKLTAVYPSTGADASTTTFSLEELSANAVTQLETYLTNVVKAAAGAVDAGKQTQLQNFFTNSKSSGLYQIAYMLDQLYFNNTLWASGNDAVKTAIKGEGHNLIFNDLSSFAETTEGKLFEQVNSSKVNYLGDLYPIGGKTVAITCDFGTPNSSSVSFENNTNTFYRPTSLYYMANSYLVSYTSEPSWNDKGVAAGEFVDLSGETPSKVALKDQIQYAVGQLEVNFKVTNATLSGREDTDANIDPKDINLKGIIIGNQKQAGWDFLPTSETKASDAAYDNTGVKDNDGSASGTSDNIYGKMQMLALPTKAQQPVVIALELENASEKEFEGANGGIIPAGATFYVTAELKPQGRTVDGVNDEDVAVFMSDYVTKANLTLSSLEFAENTVPDLDNANLEFALSVDLEWKSGIEFNVTIP